MASDADRPRGLSALDAPPAPLREVRYEVSRDFVQLLEQAGVSLLVSTYQAGKLVVVGTDRGELVLSFLNFEQAMGLALSRQMMAVGTRYQVWLLARETAMASQLNRGRAHDDCYLARRSHFTGQIHIHELAWGGADGSELWIVNTLFSCLCTLDDRHSFVPRWRPPFISGLAAEDRCHLNGLAMDAGQPRFVAAMSESDQPQGWRPTKVQSGCVIDVASGEAVVRGLAMPHSPRLAGGRLWVLDSGRGNISVIDPASGRFESVEQVPGYTRGLAFHGPFAFVGMSRIRETSTFGGVPIAERRDELRCGVAVVDMRRGKAVAYIEFKTGVEEIFAVEVVPDVRCPFVSGPSPTDDDTQAVWVVPQAAGDRVQGSGFRIQSSVSSSQPPLTTHQSPQTAEEWNDHGGRLMEQAQYDAAEAAYRRALEIKPQCGAAWANLAFLTADRGQTEEGRRLYEIAYKHQPSPQLGIVRATVLPPIYRDARHIQQVREVFASEVAALVAGGVRIDPTRTTTPTVFFLAYQGLNDRDLMAQLGSLAVSPRSWKPPAHRSPGQRTRIGFLSRYLCDHTIGKLNVGIIEKLDRKRFEVVVLSAAAMDDSVTRRIRQAADRYLGLPGELGAALDMISGQSLDILHYPDIGMAPFTYTLAHSRLAPLQTVTWGHPVTSGLPTIDHFISCRDAEAEGADAHYTECLGRLSRLGVCMERPHRSGPGRKREYFQLSDDSHVYACPQMMFKFHPDFDEVLAGVLRGDPRGVVVIIEAKYREWQELLVNRWSRNMPDVVSRIRFVPRMPRCDFLELLACSDVMLDPFPFGGGHSSYEALALGLPVVTLPGSFLRGRLTYAMYCQMGYRNFIASGAADYIQLALRLGADSAERASASAAILQSCDSLFGDVEAVRELEQYWEEALEQRLASI
jgi:uncharacterized protein (TIGR03032 family)